MNWLKRTWTVEISVFRPPTSTGVSCGFCLDQVTNHLRSVAWSDDPSVLFWWTWNIVCFGFGRPLKNLKKTWVSHVSLRLAFRYNPMSWGSSPTKAYGRSNHLVPWLTVYPVPSGFRKPIFAPRLRLFISGQRVEQGLLECLLLPRKHGYALCTVRGAESFIDQGLDGMIENLMAEMAHHWEWSLS
jgi:hypothetical protein